MLLTLLFILALFFVLGKIFKYVLPRILYWYMHRKVKQQYERQFGQQQQSRSNQSNSRYNPFGSRTRSTKNQSQTHTRRGKIFGPDDGEYVDFEDIPTYRDLNDPQPPSPPKSSSSSKDDPQISDADWEDIK